MIHKTEVHSRDREHRGLPCTSHYFLAEAFYQNIQGDISSNWQQNDNLSSI